MTDTTTHTISSARLEMGKWNHERNRDEGEGDINTSYSADIIAMESRVRKPFTFAGNLWITVSLSGCGGVEQAEAYRLIPLRMFIGETTTYKEKTCTADGAEAARNDPMGFYNAMRVSHGKEQYVLCGPKADFVVEQEPVRPDMRPVEPEQMKLFA